MRPAVAYHDRMAETRFCEQCGSAFEPRREHARFCTAFCRMAWNRAHAGQPAPEGCALEWSIAAMRDSVQRLETVEGCPSGFVAISEAVWWVTLVDATLLRYHSAVYDRALAGHDATERRLAEETFAGLRFVRNRMGYYCDPADFIEPVGAAGEAEPGGVLEWRWRPMPEPPLGALPPRGQAWELGRYHAYQARLARQTMAGTFRRATAFLVLAAAQAGLAHAGRRRA